MLSKKDIDKIKEIVLSAAEIVQEIGSAGIEVTYKSDGSPVTNADIAASKYIMTHLKDVIPEVPLISEEEEIPSEYGDTFWLIDPIDGTRSYIIGDPSYTINVGLVVEGVPLFGFVQNPATGNLYFTNENGEMRIEHDGVNIPLNIPLSSDFKALLSTHANQEVKDIIAQHEITSYEIIPGALKFCIIAAGKADLYPRHGETMEWDTAAGHALIKAVGGEIFDLTGGILQYGKPNLLNKGFVAYSQRLLSRIK